MFKSGLFPDIKSAAQAMVKVLAGQEIGVGPFASMSGINIIQGKAEYGAHIQAAVLKRGGRYDYKVRQLDDTCARIEFFQLTNEGWVSIGESKFDQTDAKRQGTKNLDRFPRNMLFARAMTNGIAWYCPDVSMVRMYGEGELRGGVMPDDGPPTNGPVIDQEPEAPKTNGNGHDGPGPRSGPEVYEWLSTQALANDERYGDALADETTCKRLSGAMDKAFGSREKRVLVTEALFGFTSTGKKTLDGTFESYVLMAQAAAILEWLDVADGEWAPRAPNATQEAANLWQYVQSSLAQDRLDDRTDEVPVDR